MPGGEITKGWVIYFVVGKVKPYHLTFVIVKCHAKGVFSVEGFPFRKLDIVTVEERFEIFEYYYINATFKASRACDLTPLDIFLWGLLQQTSKP